MLLLGLTAGLARAELYQLIRVDVLTFDRVRVERVEVPMEKLTETIKERVKGPDRIRIRMYLPIGTSKKVKKDVMDRCRAAGATSFSLVYKS